MRIVIADDVDTQRWMLIGMLRSLGHEIVATCENGIEAIAAVRMHQPDLVILDNAMQKMSGLEAAQKIAKLPKAPRIILATNQGHEGIAKPAKAIGAALCLKPYKEARLSAAIAGG